VRRVLACLALALASPAVATSVLDRGLAELLDRADAWLYGDVVAAEASIGEDGEVRTRVDIVVERDLSRSDGSAAEGGRHTLSFLGGTLPDGRTAVVDDVPRLAPGDRVLVLAYGDDRLASPVVGVWQGVWWVDSEGLRDLDGRVLGLDDGGLRYGGAERDVDSVLDALAAGTEAVAPAPTEPESEPSAEADGAGGAEPPGATSDANGGLPAVPAPDPQSDRPLGEPPGEAPGDASAADDPSPGGEPPAGAGVAAPIELRIDVPDDATLRAAVEAAAAAWRDAGAPMRVTFDEDAPDRIRVGDASLFGPDALAFSRRTLDAPGVEVLLRPGGDGRRLDVLARELGLLAGLPDGGSAVRSGRLPARTPAAPTVADAQALLAARSGAPEDLNGDGRVDLYDLALLAEAYGRVGTRLAADLDGSGTVDDADMERLRAAYEFLPAERQAPEGRRATGN
jgi:hypothetical protein